MRRDHQPQGVHPTARGGVLAGLAGASIILDVRYHSAGVACWKGADYVAYWWCMLFYK
ncbi:hypothetical protein ANACOL_02296 [Anaerotruncus colihominis DSM 17241]|uniref:Uncharacterized protein n=1 Tax=Anaerotruncus colihominis DSM 17241 TaxID=445972 RepID=B0PBY8_9FIRM|nr:hypothetical protein ANACOL_02296 [Anaerotruncus colihominis DSM 17241]